MYREDKLNDILIAYNFPEKKEKQDQQQLFLQMTDQEKDEYILMINQSVDTGREVMCIDNEDVEVWLTKGKRYKVYSHDMNPSIRVITDQGTNNSFSAERFQSRQDIREEKLTQLGL